MPDVVFSMSSTNLNGFVGDGVLQGRRYCLTMIDPSPLQDEVSSTLEVRRLPEDYRVDRPDV
jgi:hypothetical protein